ncbi:MAG: choice-of-anchor D domain-containing protein [Desulfopila sp.]|jgi:hypothetical protein|nr:choice-of-anchor D domain-containing protein [Desulfopila sp.]
MLLRLISNPLYLSGVPGTVLGALLWGGEGNTHYGDTVTGVGDVNGDGFDDVIIGAPDVRTSGLNFSAGEAILFYGTRGTFGSSMVKNLFSDGMNASEGVRFRGVAQNQKVGQGIAGAGDVNGDGFSDFLIGSNEGDQGTIYLIYGKSSQISSSVEFSLSSSALNGTNGVTIRGGADYTWLGAADNYMSGAGDVNGDGYADILLLAENAAFEGKVFLIYGSATGIGSGNALDLSTMSTNEGVVISNSGSIEYWSAVSGAGDVNGDGYDDILLGSLKLYLAPNSADDTGGAVILYGSGSGLGTSGALTVSETMLDGTNGTRFIGPSPWGNGAGNRVSSVGDVNGDGFSDFTIAAPNWGYWTTHANQGNGRVYLVYGNSAPLGALGDEGTLFMINLNGSNGTKLNGPNNYTYLGWSISSLGDINGDGLADIPASAHYEDSQKGRTYVVYGRQGGINSSSDYDIGSIFTQHGTKMIGANENERSGTDISGIGDFNGDGVSDIIIGAPEANNPLGGSFGCGKAYLVWGDGVTTTTSTVKAYVMKGDAPKRGIGMTGDGRHTYPLSGVWIDYDDGSYSNGASLETVIFSRLTPTGSGLPTDLANGYWQLQTNRTGWTSAELTFKYSLNTIGILDPGSLSLYRADAAAGPYERITTTSNSTNSTLTATVSKLGYFAIGIPQPGPEIDVVGNGLSIADGDATPSDLDGTDFGIVDVVGSGYVDHTFTVRNLGIDDLSLTGSPTVSLSGDNASDFSVVTQPNALIQAGATSDFIIRFAPTVEGERTVTVQIENNDSDEDPYSFTLKGGKNQKSGTRYYILNTPDGKAVIIAL